MRARRLVWLTLSLLLVPLLLVALRPARAEGANDAVYVVSYIEVAAPAVKLSPSERKPGALRRARISDSLWYVAQCAPAASHGASRP